MAKIYKLTLKQKSGLLTELESDTIFGHFCWRMRELLGEDELSKFLNFFVDGKPVFTLSNSCFERDGVVYLPNPIIPHKEKNSPETKDEKIKQFMDFKISKERKLLTLDEFNQVLNGNEPDLSEKADIPKYTEDLRTSVEISRETFSSIEGHLFSYAPMFVDEIIVDNKKQEYSDTKTIIFIKIIDEKNFTDYKCEAVLKEVFEVGFGKKKSSGYGEFEVIGNLGNFEGFTESEDANGFVTLSNYLPSVNDGLKMGSKAKEIPASAGMTDSREDNETTSYYYDFKLKYGKLGEELALSENPFKKPIVLLLPGSVFRTDMKKDYYGRCTTEGELSEVHKFVIQNGFVFTLDIKI